MTWRMYARCRKLVEAGEASPDWWFPNSCDADASRRAREICQSCPVREECAIAGASEAGIWGGLNTKERRPLRALHRRCTRCGVPIPGRHYYCGSCALNARQESRARSKKNGGPSSNLSQAPSTLADEEPQDHMLVTHRRVIRK